LVIPVREETARRVDRVRLIRELLHALPIPRSRPWDRETRVDVGRPDRVPADVEVRGVAGRVNEHEVEPERDAGRGPLELRDGLGLSRARPGEQARDDAAVDDRLP